MIPIRDNIRLSCFPVVNSLLITVNLLVFGHMILLPSEDAFIQFFINWGFVPNQFHTSTLISSQFLHGGIPHLFGNMLFLWIFGSSVENRVGHLKYLVFYLGTGVAAGLTHYVFNSDSPLPTVGASGAVSGVMGAYLLFFPHARIVTIIPIFFYPLITEFSAFFFLCQWFLIQLLFGMMSFGMQDGGGIAVLAHIGGFVSGLVICAVFREQLKGRMSTS